MAQIHTRPPNKLRVSGLIDLNAPHTRLDQTYIQKFSLGLSLDSQVELFLPGLLPSNLDRALGLTLMFLREVNVKALEHLQQLLLNLTFILNKLQEVNSVLT